MKTEKQLQVEKLVGGDLTEMQLILFNLFKDDDRYEFYFDGNNLAARLK